MLNNSQNGHELDIELEFPGELDPLEEFIQSYYSVLDGETYLQGYPFVVLEKNRFINADKLLGDFYTKLMRLRSGLQQELTIFQIGDSHIKPGQFSNSAERSLSRYIEGAEAPDRGTLSYHYTGINGASFFNLMSNESVFERCRELDPDLIVISLGTNDAQGKYDNTRFRKQLRAFMDKLVQGMELTPVIFTLPPDSYKGGKQNQDLAKVSTEIISYAREKDYAWWDLGSVMGGSGSIKNWRARDYASRDMVHFNPNGYTLQGYLFYHALMRGYKSYTEGRGR